MKNFPNFPKCPFYSFVQCPVFIGINILEHYLNLLNTKFDCMKKTIILTSIFALFFTLLISCKEDPGANSGDMAQLKIFLTDAPAEYDAVYIDVLSVEIHTDADGWKTLNVINPGIYDLLKFNSGIDTVIIDEDIAPQTISQIRLILGDNNSVVVDGVVHPLEAPSAETSGLKLNVHYTFEAGIAYELWMDFDAEQSIVEKGNGDYSLKPVIHVYTQAETGAISGTVFPFDAAYYVMASTPTDTIGTLIAADGSFLIGGVPAGTYDVTFSAVAGFSDITVNDVNVQTGNVTTLGVINIPF